jgi:hypothetical protein
MSLNYAEIWAPELLPIRIQEMLTSPFVVQNVNWLGARSFHFTQMSVSGFKTHSRGGGWNAGTISQNDNEFKVEFSRDVQFLIDKADVDETNSTASIQNVAKVLEMTQLAPETDAYFFSKVAQKALTLTGFYSSTAKGSYAANNVLSKIKSFIAPVKRYRRSLIVYIASWVMDLLELSTELDKKVEMTQVADGGLGIETRVTFIDGVPIIEVIDDDRFYDKFNFTPQTGGFEPIAQVLPTYALTQDVALVATKTYYTRGGSAGAYTYTKVATPDVSDIATYYELTNTPVTGSKKINVLVASTETVITVPKISSIYAFAPGSHTEGDGWLYQHREDYDTFIFPNGKNNAIDSIYVDMDTAEYTTA